MTAYEILQNIKPEHLQILISSGLLKPLTARDMKAYQYYYQDLKRTRSKMVTRCNTAEKFNCCEMVVSRIIKRLNNERI